MKKIIQAIVGYFDPLRFEKEKAAARFIDRVLVTIKNKGEEGCTDSDFTHSFKLQPFKEGIGEADLADYVLNQLCIRGRVKKEIRYFLVDE